MKVLLFVIILSLGFFKSTHAFPELTRFKYNNCMACHLSPAGGGILTHYGRKLSNEVLNMWGSEKSSHFLHGLIDEKYSEESPLLFGGDIRTVQTYKEDEQIKIGKYIVMQTDLSMAYASDKLSISGTIGRKFNVTDWQYAINNFYILYRPNEILTIRPGYYLPQYGLNIKDHIAYVRSLLNFNYDTLKPTIEIQYNGENNTANLSYAGKDSSNSADNEELTLFEYQYFFLDHNKLALNFLDGKTPVYRRNAFGFWGLFSLTPTIFFVTESDWQNQNQIPSFASYQKLGYTLSKGLDLLFLYETQQSDMGSLNTKTERLGPGLQFFPWPHIEINGAWTKIKTYLNPTKQQDYAWLLLHYYF